VYGNRIISNDERITYSFHALVMRADPQQADVHIPWTSHPVFELKLTGENSCSEQGKIGCLP
jgi:hypothetical protein